MPHLSPTDSAALRASAAGPISGKRPRTLPQGRALFARAVEAYAQHVFPGAEQEHFVILYADINELELINLALCDAAGDAALEFVRIRFGLLLSSFSDVPDFVLHRVREDEFGIACRMRVAPGAGDVAAQLRKAASGLCRRLVQGIADHPMEWHGASESADVDVLVAVTVGASVASWTTGSAANSSAVVEGMAQAELAARRFRYGDRGLPPVFDALEEQFFRTRLVAIQLARNALQHDRIRAHYQPQVDLRNGNLLGAEALMRITRDGQDGFVPLYEVLPFVEDTEFIEDLGMAMFRLVLKDMREWKRQGLLFPVSINVAARQLRNPDFPAQVLALMAEYPDIPEHYIILELVETAGISDLSAANQAIERLRKKGIRFHLDDFGTGFSSFAYLKGIAVEAIKIDQSFIRALLEDPKDQAIVESLIAIGDKFGIEVIAEGVETEAIAYALKRLGCYRIQGYLFARPMSAAALQTWIRSKLLPQAIGTDGYRLALAPLLEDQRIFG